MTLILDSPAVVSVVCREREHGRLIGAMEGASELAVGAPTLARAGTEIAERHGPPGRAALSLLLERLPIRVIPFDEQHSTVAASAASRYGAGHHPAALDEVECMTYATAYLAEAPLLSVGRRFPLTDLPIAGD